MTVIKYRQTTILYTNIDIKVAMSVSKGEALGLLCGLQWVMAMSFTHVTSEVDCKQVVDKLKDFKCDSTVLE